MREDEERDDDRDDDDEEEPENEPHQEDLNHDSGKWYSSRWLGIAGVATLAAFGLTYKFGYDEGTRDGVSETAGGQVPCPRPESSTRMPPAPAASDSASPPAMELECETNFLGNRLCRTIRLPPGEKLVSVTISAPGALPAVLTRPIPSGETPTEYVMHLPSEFGGEHAYKVIETAASASASARTP